MNELHYSEAAAGRRISAMRLLTELPEVAPAIENGSLNLSTASTVQSFFNREKADQGKTYSLNQKREILESIAHKSKRETETFLATISPESVIAPEKVKPLTKNHTVLRIIVDENTLEKIEKLKDLLAHQNPEGSYGKLLSILSEIALDHLDPERKQERIEKRKLKKQEIQPTPDILPSTPPAELQESNVKSSNPRYIPAQVRRQVY